MSCLGWRGFGAIVFVALWLPMAATPLTAEGLRAGAARVDVTHLEAGPVNDPLYVKALGLRSGETTAVLNTVDAVAIGEIGPIKNDYLPTVRSRLQQELGIDPQCVLVNASHCHGVVCPDVADRTVQAVRTALEQLVPVRVGAGRGHEDRISQNRRLILKNGREIDVRPAYPLPPDDEIAAVGPIDPEIGLLRLDREDGRPLAVVYNFACHPIQGVPGGGNTADLVGFASRVIEENLDPDAVALFVQGCGGDINPIGYKAPDQPRNAEPLGQKLGLSTLRGLRGIECRDDDRLIIRQATLALPRGDRSERIAQLESEQRRLANSLQGTTLNFKSFLPLAVKYQFSPDYPAAESHRYLHDAAQGVDDYPRLDADNRRQLAIYLRNIHIMEELTRVQANLALLRKHQARFIAAGSRTIDVELMALRVGDFALVSFPGELTVQIGLNLKAASPHDHTFVAGYTNGYIYYAPTSEQLMNVGGAQEDSDCLLAPEWQALFEARAQAMLRDL